MGRGERNGLQMLVPSLPLFPHPHARILRETSVPCSFSSTRPPGSTNRRGLPQYYYNRLGKCVHVFFVVVTERLFSLQNKWAEHARMGETRKARAVMSRPRRRQLLSLARRYLRTSGSGIGHSSLQLLSTTQMPPVRVSVWEWTAPCWTRMLRLQTHTKWKFLQRNVCWGLMELAAQRRLRVVYFVNNHGSDYGGHWANWERDHWQH